MKKTQFLELLGEIDKNFVLSAHSAKFNFKWVKILTPIAACVALIVIPFSLNYNNVPNGTKETPSTFAVNVNSIKLNDIKFQAMEQKIHFKEEHIEIIWNEEDITKYFGKEISVPYVPDFLIPSENNESMKVLISKETGNVLYDLLTLQYYHEYNSECGCPTSTETINAKKGFSLYVSKLDEGFFFDYLYEKDKIEHSEIYSVQVVFSHSNYSYGPYDSETHVPSGYYDMYFANFSIDDTHYLIEASQLSLEEVVKIATSIITNKKEITLI